MVDRLGELGKAAVPSTGKATGYQDLSKEVRGLAWFRLHAHI